MAYTEACINKGAAAEAALINNAQGSGRVSYQRHEYLTYGLTAINNSLYCGALLSETKRYRIATSEPMGSLHQ